MVYTDTQLYNFNPDIEMLTLPAQRRELVEGITNDRARRLSIMAYQLLCHGLWREYGITVPPVFSYEEGGKPVLRDYPHIHFNLSHCRAGAACAISDRPVGIDCESLRPYKDDLARHVLSEEEYQRVDSADDKAAAFISLWTRKEALLKLTGEGLRRDLRTLLPRDDVYFRTVLIDDQQAQSAQRTKMIVTVCEFER